MQFVHRDLGALMIQQPEHHHSITQTINSLNAKYYLIILQQIYIFGTLGILITKVHTSEALNAIVSSDFTQWNSDDIK